MKPSIRNKILSIVVSALALLTLLAGLANWKFNLINANRETVAIASTALRDQLEADMKLVNQLAPGGYFVVGHSESLLGIKHPLTALKPGIYRKNP
jgi:CHASE3 domain sensor protein